MEAIIRLSESLAKMKLNPIVERADVEEANWIFEISTMESLKSDFPMSVDPGKTKLILEIED